MWVVSEGRQVLYFLMKEAVVVVSLGGKEWFTVWV